MCWFKFLMVLEQNLYDLHFTFDALCVNIWYFKAASLTYFLQHPGVVTLTLIYCCARQHGWTTFLDIEIAYCTVSLVLTLSVSLFMFIATVVSVRDRVLHKTLRSFALDNVIHISTFLQNLMYVFPMKSLL